MFPILMVLYSLLLHIVKNCIEEDQNLKKKLEHISDNCIRHTSQLSYQNKQEKTLLWFGVKLV